MITVQAATRAGGTICFRASILHRLSTKATAWTSIWTIANMSMICRSVIGLTTKSPTYTVCTTTMTKRAVSPHIRESKTWHWHLMLRGKQMKTIGCAMVSSYPSSGSIQTLRFSRMPRFNATVAAWTMMAMNHYITRNMMRQVNISTTPVVRKWTSTISRYMLRTTSRYFTISNSTMDCV